MAAAEALLALPAHVPAAVVFRLEPLRPLLDPAGLARMLGLPGPPPDSATHATVTATGTVLMHRGDPVARHAASGAPLVAPVPAESLLAAYASRLRLLPAGEPDCVGVGRFVGHGPVALHVTIDGTLATGVAVFDREPDPSRLGLLGAVGVEYQGARPAGDAVVATFTNRLDEHLRVAQLTGFARTDHCNRFFLHHGRPDEPLRRGLEAAARTRIVEARERADTAVDRLVHDALRRPLTLTAVPPPPAPAFHYGDVVPLGFLRAALGERAPAALDRRLAELARGALWPFHRGGLPTATDTALVAHGLGSVPAIHNALEPFADAGGGYLPQLAGDYPGQMSPTDANRHWRQPDFGTTALITGLRRAQGRASGDNLAWLARRSSTRGSLFFANPYLTDWALAQAVAGTVHAAALRAEIEASTNPDGSFGSFDPALSTALAILALDTLGAPVRTAQLQLARALERDGRAPAATPFYSALDAGGSAALTLYRDDERLITTALAARALAVPSSDGGDEAGREPVAPHVRYGCADVAEYVLRHALLPYWLAAQT